MLRGVSRWRLPSRRMLLNRNVLQAYSQPSTATLGDVQSILSEENAALFAKEKDLLLNMNLLIEKLGAPKEDLSVLTEAVGQLDAKFLLVVVGEFNSGKSSFINAMLGEKFVKSGVTPTTDTINIIGYGDRLPEAAVGTGSVRHLSLPVEWLREINIVDTPGTNAVVQGHQELTEHFVPRSDLVLFVTSAYSPFSESEREFMEHIKEWGKKIIVVLNKFDVLEEPEEQKQVVTFVRDNVAALLSDTPVMFPVSSKKALELKAAGSALTSSDGTGFLDLESFILRQLDQETRLVLKLTSPLGLVDQLHDKYGKVLQARRKLLEDDLANLKSIEEMLLRVHEDTEREFQTQLARIDSVLYQFAERGDKFFQETYVLSRIFDLVNSEKLKKEFEKNVVQDLSRDMERYITDFIDWFVDTKHKQWKTVQLFHKKGRRATPMADEERAILRDVSVNDYTDRRALLEDIGSTSQRVIAKFDKKAEAEKLAKEVRASIVTQAGIQGAIGLGSVLVAAMTDVSGTLMAATLAAGSLYLLPYKREKLRTELRTKIDTLRAQLIASVTSSYQEKSAEENQRIQEILYPYSQFIKSSSEDLDKLSKQLDDNAASFASLRKEIARLERKNA